MNTRYKMIKVMIIVMALITAGCVKKDNMDYTGEYPELYSIAIHSLLGSTGYAVSERKFSPKIILIEEDTYGRKLFLYFENKSVSTYSLLISQKSDEEYAYFYPDYNFISIPEGERADPDLIATSEKDFPLKEIEELKRKNDWDMEIDTAKCIKVKIVRKKEKGLIKNRKLKEFYYKALGEEAHGQYKHSINFFISDDYGRSIYLGYGKFSNNRFIVVLLFQPDGSYDEKTCQMKLSDTQKYQEDLKKFKELNDWNQPFQSE